MKRFLRSLVLALAYFWFYTTTNGYVTYTQVWQPVPGESNGGHWEPHDTDYYMPGVTKLGLYWAG